MNISVRNFDFVVMRPPNPNWKINNLSNDHFYIIGLALSGEADYFFSGQNHQVAGGQVIFFQKGLKHSACNNHENPLSYYSVAFDLVFYDQSDIEIFEKMPTIQTISNIVEMKRLFNKLNKTWTSKETGYLLRCRGILNEILYLLFWESQNVCKSAHIESIKQVIDYMSTNYVNSYSIAELAQMSNLSPSHFRALFKKITGLTVIQYQNQIKIEKAKDFMRSGECNVTEAAAFVGFEDTYYFSKVFKKATGIAPSEFIKNSSFI